MPRVKLDKDKPKDALKKALVEVLEERRDLVRDIVEESIEDVAMIRVLKAGEKTRKVRRAQVFKVLEAGG